MSSTTFTDGYTVGKRNAHVVTALVVLFLGAVLIYGRYVKSDSRNTIMLVIGVVLALVGLLSLVPILRQPVVEGRIISTAGDDGTPRPSSCPF